MISLENTHKSNIIHTEQVIFRIICVYTYIKVTTIIEKEVMSLKKKSKSI